MYLMFKDGVLYQSETLLELSSHFTIDITYKGQVIFEGKTDTISYSTNDFSPNEIMEEFVAHRMLKLIKGKGIQIWRAKLL